jgi:hypothetical protein
MTPIEALHKSLSMDKRITELEKIIATDAEQSFYYAMYMIKGAWDEGEKVISKDAYVSYFYAINILEDIFEKGHHTIFKSQYKDDYIEFLKKNNKYDEKKLLQWMI